MLCISIKAIVLIIRISQISCWCKRRDLLFSLLMLKIIWWYGQNADNTKIQPPYYSNNNTLQQLSIVKQTLTYVVYNEILAAYISRMVIRAKMIVQWNSWSLTVHVVLFWFRFGSNWRSSILLGLFENYHEWQLSLCCYCSVSPSYSLEQRELSPTLNDLHFHWH